MLKVQARRLVLVPPGVKTDHNKLHASQFVSHKIINGWDYFGRHPSNSEFAEKVLYLKVATDFIAFHGLPISYTSENFCMYGQLHNLINVKRTITQWELISNIDLRFVR